MNVSTCPECGAMLTSTAIACPACLLSAGEVTWPVHPVSSGVAALPCDFGNYRLRKKLGTGGMGIVYEAEEQNTGRRVALKVLCQSLEDDRQRHRFLKEGRLAATIHHPNSIYIYGTAEIESVPVITMELATGGTLRDRVKRQGPLPVRDAVDAILGVIDGLEAAQARGVLHRDVKPSNCFISGDGRTIVGDYGLSISQAADAMPLSHSGQIVGTPAYSPPEQLRGQPLDTRADIYSAAGTLYYLLTGRAPVEGRNPVETVAAVLEGNIIPLKTLRPEIPDDLAAIVMRSLSAERTRRPATHGELRSALLAFSSAASEPAPLGLRFLAGLLDDMMLLAIGLGLPALFPFLSDSVWNAEEDSLSTALAKAAMVMGAYASMEAVWGATPGKGLCGLRLLRRDGARPSWVQALGRAAMYVLPYMLAQYWLDHSGYFEFGDSLWPSLVTLLAAIVIPEVQLLLFVTVFHSQDHAALHDLATGLRVVKRGRDRKRVCALRAKAQPFSVIVPVQWGPVEVTAETAGWKWGQDPILQRPVLIRNRTHQEIRMAEARRTCTRAGRLRWLQSLSDEQNAIWDVWQLPPGEPLPNLLKRTGPSLPWDAVVFWLQDLAVEMHAASVDGTLPPRLSLAHVWITTDGRAILLDEPWPELQADELTSFENPQPFLHRLASLAPACKRPVHADALITSLKQGTFDRLSHVVGNLEHIARKDCHVSRRKYAACVFGPVVSAALFMMPIIWLDYKDTKDAWEREFPDLPPLPMVMRLYELQNKRNGTGTPVIDAIHVHVAGHYKVYVTEHGIESLPSDLFFTSGQQRTVSQILNRIAVPDPPKLKAADEVVNEALARALRSNHLPDIILETVVLVLTAQVVVLLLTLGLISILQLVMILGIGSPLLMRLAGIAIVSPCKRPASRLRVTARWAFNWVFLYSALALVLFGTLTNSNWLRALPPAAVMLAILATLLVTGLTHILPRRTLVDRLSGTWLVAR